TRFSRDWSSDVCSSDLKSTGGIVQIVTKTGSNAFHGSVGGYFAPQQFEAQRLQVDDFGLGGSQQKFNLQGKTLHQSNYDADAQRSEERRVGKESSDRCP